MFRKIISIAVIIALVNLVGIGSVFAKSNAEKELRLSIKVKENIEKLGTGEAAKVKITLKDKSKIEGYVSQINEDSFQVTENGQTTEIEYSEVKKVQGNNLSTGAKIAIGAGIGLAILVIAVIANRKVCSNALCQ
jgi:ribosomal protein S13